MLVLALLIYLCSMQHLLLPLSQCPSRWRLFHQPGRWFGQALRTLVPTAFQLLHWSSQQQQQELWSRSTCDICTTRETLTLILNCVISVPFLCRFRLNCTSHGECRAAVIEIPFPTGHVLHSDTPIIYTCTTTELLKWYQTTIRVQFLLCWVSLGKWINWIWALGHYIVVSALNHTARIILAELYDCFCSDNSLIDSLLMRDWLVFSSPPPHATVYFGCGHQQTELEHN